MRRRTVTVWESVLLSEAEVLEKVGLDEQGDGAEPEGKEAVENGDDTILGVVEFWLADPDDNCAVHELKDQHPDTDEQNSVYSFLDVMHQINNCKR